MANTDHAELAKSFFLKGYNCSQSVAAAFAGEMGLTDSQALKMSAGFGGGFGRLREVCGTFSGIVFVVSTLYGNDDPAGKSAFYAQIQSLAAQFRDASGGGSIICRDLLGGAGVSVDASPNAQSRTPEFYKQRPCLRLVMTAAEIAEQYINSHPLPENSREC